MLSLVGIKTDVFLFTEIEISSGLLCIFGLGLGKASIDMPTTFLGVEVAFMYIH